MTSMTRKKGLLRGVLLLAVLCSAELIGVQGRISEGIHERLQVDKLAHRSQALRRSIANADDRDDVKNDALQVMEDVDHVLMKEMNVLEMRFPSRPVLTRQNAVRHLDEVVTPAAAKYFRETFLPECEKKLKSKAYCSFPADKAHTACVRLVKGMCWGDNIEATDAARMDCTKQVYTTFKKDKLVRSSIFSWAKKKKIGAAVFKVAVAGGAIVLGILCPPVAGATLLAGIGASIAIGTGATVLNTAADYAAATPEERKKGLVKGNIVKGAAVTVLSIATAGVAGGIAGAVEGGAAAAKVATDCGTTLGAIDGTVGLDHYDPTTGGLVGDAVAIKGIKTGEAFGMCESLDTTVTQQALLTGSKKAFTVGDGDGQVEEIGNTVPTF